MLTKIMKWSSIAAVLLLLILLPRHAYANYSTVLAAFIVWAGSVVVLVQAVHLRKYVWMSLFLVVAVFFNPVVPVVLSRTAFIALDSATLVMFLLSLAALKSAPRLSMASITDRTPGSLSL